MPADSPVARIASASTATVARRGANSSDASAPSAPSATLSVGASTTHISGTTPTAPSPAPTRSNAYSRPTEPT